ncbi:MAG: thioester domain-containing protein [Propionibacteriaceae bacterium]
MTATLRSYDHYAPDVAATVLPGAAVPTSLRWTTVVPRRHATPGTPIRWAGATAQATALVRLEEQVGAYALTPGGTGATYREVSWHDSSHLGAEWALTQVLAQGYPTVGIDELRRRLRRARYRVAADELTVADAIAGTQAAVWRITTGNELETRHVNLMAVSHLYEYLLARTGLPGYGQREVSTAVATSYFVAGVSAVEVSGADVVDAEGRSLAGVLIPGQRFQLRGRGHRITLRHGAVRARLLVGDGAHLVTLTSQTPVVVDHILG